MAEFLDEVNSEFLSDINQIIEAGKALNSPQELIKKYGQPKNIASAVLNWNSGLNRFHSYKMFILSTKGMKVLRLYLNDHTTSGFMIWFNLATKYNKHIHSVDKEEVRQALETPFSETEKLVITPFNKTLIREISVRSIKLLAYFFNRDDFWDRNLPYFIFSPYDILQYINDPNLPLLIKCLYLNKEVEWNKLGFIRNMPMNAINDLKIIFDAIGRYRKRNIGIIKAPIALNGKFQSQIKNYTIYELKYYFEINNVKFRDFSALYYASIGYIASWAFPWALLKRNCTSDDGSFTLAYLYGKTMNEYQCFSLSEIRRYLTKNTLIVPGKRGISINDIKSLKSMLNTLYRLTTTKNGEIELNLSSYDMSSIKTMLSILE